MKCSICGKPIILIPSAEDRARKYGETPEYYRRLFTAHSDCQLAKRREESKTLLRTLTDTQ